MGLTGAGLVDATDSQLAALKWLLNRNGDGAFAEKSNKSVLIAGGDRAPIMRGTWLRLEELGLVERYMDGKRLRVTGAGRATRLHHIDESR